MNIGKQIQKFRKNHNLSQADFALLAGISQRSVSYVESGRNVSSKNREKIEDTFKIENPVNRLENFSKSTKLPNRDFDVTDLVKDLASSGEKVTFGDVLQIALFKFARKEEGNKLPEKLQKFL